MADDFDMVSDLNDGTAADGIISAHDGDVSTGGKDAINVNQAQTREQPAVAKKVGKTEADTGEKPRSLRDQISSALKGEDDTPQVATKDGQVRDPLTGKFATKPAVDPAVVADPAAAAPLAAPAGIKPEVFQSLPAETQAELARTMEDIGKSQQRFAHLAPIEELIASRIQPWALNGLQPAQALNQLLALSDFATRDGPAFVKWFAQNNGVDLEQLVFKAEPVDPVYKELTDRIADLEGRHTREAQLRQQAAQQQTVNSVAAFAEEKGQDGNPLRPYFSELGDSVLPFISAIKSANPTWNHNQVLQEAYDRACWGTPSVRAKMQAASQAASEAERLRAAGAKVDAARTASASVPSGAPSTPRTAPADSGRNLRDTIKASMAAHST